MENISLMDQATQKMERDSPFSNQGRARFWEVEQHFKCPLVGLCLTLNEQQRLLRKAGLSSRNRSPFTLHEIFVSLSDKDNRLSDRVNSFLNRKYAREIQIMTNMEESAFMSKWKECFDVGEFEGALWVAVTRHGLSGESKHEIFGAVHMSMHRHANETGKLRRRIAFLEKANESLELKIQGHRSEAKALKQENTSLRALHWAIDRKVSLLEKEKAHLEKEYIELRDNKCVAELEERNRKLEAKALEFSAREKSRESENASLSRANENLKEIHSKERKSLDRLRAESREIIREIIQMNRCDESCPSFDLCSKRILFVGGLTRMEDLYRQMIEGNGGVFEYHSGYIKGGTKALEKQLMRADIVLCPINCNSHAACSTVKNMGKKHNKKVHFLRSSSLSAIGSALSAKITTCNEIKH